MYQCFLRPAFQGNINKSKKKKKNQKGPNQLSEERISSTNYFGIILVSLVAQLVNNTPARRETWVQSWVGKIPWRRERLPSPVFWPGEFHGLHSPWGHRVGLLSLSLFTYWEKMNYFEFIICSCIVKHKLEHLGSSSLLMKSIFIVKEEK